MTKTESEALKTLLSDLVSAKAGDAPESELQALITRCSLMLLSYKGSSRAGSEATELLREETSAARSALEVSNLRLQNLLYERQHYEADIRGCLRHHSAFSDADIELLPVQQFLRTARDGAAARGEHELMVARLRHEKAARVALLQQLDALRARKNELVGSEAQKARFLETLRDELGAIESAARGVKGHLSLAPLVAALPAEAEALPLPLYVLLSQLSTAQAPADATVECRVVAAPAAVAAAPAALAAPAAAAPVEPENEDTVMEEAHTQHAQLATAAVCELARRSAIVHPHAVSVCVRMMAAPAAAGVIFVYVPSAHAVRALPGAGTEAAALSGLVENDSSASGAFRWAQRLAGLDFIPPPPEGTLLARGPAAATAGHVLAGLAEYRQQQRAEGALELLKLACRPATK